MDPEKTPQGVKQAATQAIDPTAKEPAGEKAGEQVSELEQALKEFDQGTKPEPKPEQGKAEEKPREEAIDPKTYRLIEKDYLERQQKETDSDVTRAAESLRENDDTLGHLSTNWLEARFRLEADRDPRVLDAFAMRKRNPDAFTRVLKGLSEKFSKELKERPDNGLTNDREVINAAVRGSSTTPPEQTFDKEKIRKMNAAEFEDYKRGL